MATRINPANGMSLLVAVLAGVLLTAAASTPDTIQLVSRCSTTHTDDNGPREIYPIPASAIDDNGKVTFKFQVKAESDITVHIYPNKTMEESAFYYELNINRDNNRSEILHCVKFKISCDTVGSSSATFPLSPKKRYSFNLNVSPGGYWALTQDDDHNLLEGAVLNPIPIQSFSMHSKFNATWVFNCTEINDDEDMNEYGEGTPEISLKNALERRKAHSPPETTAIQVDEMKTTILSMDTGKKELQVKVHLKLGWTDSRLRWNATDRFSELTAITLAATEIWTPELFQYKAFPQDIATNEAVSVDTQLQRRSVLVSNTGLVKWKFQVTLTLPCDYPLSENTDLQGKQLICSINLGEVDGKRFLQLDGQYDAQKLDVNDKWKIVKATTSSEQLKDALGNNHSTLFLQVHLEEVTET